MINRYDEIESKFGISAYASPHEGFAAVVKARYSDFVVHEVDLNGNIARLESLELPQPKVAKVEAPAETKTNSDAAGESEKKRKISEVADVPNGAKEVKEEEAPKDDWDSRKEDLTKLIGETPAQELVSFLQLAETDSANESKDKDVQKFYALPLISDKQIRRSIHQLIKTPAFNTIARADTHDGKMRIWHLGFQKDMPKDTFWKGNGGGGGNNGGNQRAAKPKRTQWPKDRPDFLNFVLYKENMDTYTAAKDVGRMAHVNPRKGIDYAGMKDKRGITTQFCSVYRMEKEQLLAVNKEVARAKAENAGGGGNTSKGGANIVKVGNFSYSSNEVRLGALSGNRFDIVLRNVDIGDVADDSAKKQLVQQKLETAGKAIMNGGFINYFGMQRFGKFHDTHATGIAVMKGDFEGAIGIIMGEKPDEYPYIAEARKQWANRFEGIDVSKDENAARESEQKCARDVQRKLGRFMNCEKSIVHTLSRKPREYKLAFGSIAKNMRSMFLHAYQSYLWNMVASHRIESGGSTEVRIGDLVLIEDVRSGKGGRNTSGLKGKNVKMVEEQDLKDNTYKITDVVLPLAGSKIRYPGGSAGDLFDELMKKDGICKVDFAKIGNMDREISLIGDYRKLICKPEDVTFEVIAYTDPVQPLLQTDLMKAHGIDITATTLCSSKEQETKPEGNEDDNNDTLFGMTVGFSLPPSAYATIALRELTKRPTSSEYQSKLELSGKCERNI
eukprot:CAMPEP_0172318450 /NCGR_PEP_ID=MMETSP1058-20130122/34921_1 /TAXON_ID=83371 /ORGANISM="Detonula confervacea, Strain CCMP 353" /LENGTH=728 /DNA_ID=CAMNT_0013033289 /DNA_START=88 /DNA_END=2271 /DNA_ORIENTATION=-